MKRIDNFIIQTTQAIYRYSIHDNNIDILVRDLNDLYAGVTSINSIKPEYTTLLYVDKSYSVCFDVAITSVVECLNNNKGTIFKNTEYERCVWFERIVELPKDTRYILLFLCLVYGDSILDNQFIKDRLCTIMHSNVIDYSHYNPNKFFLITSPICGEKCKEKYKSIFKLLSLAGDVPVYDSNVVSRVYSDIYINEELPVVVPMQLYKHSVIKKLYLRHIMLNPNDTRYINIFKQIYDTSDQSCRRALYFFSQTIPGYKITDGALADSMLGKWYAKEMDDQQLDSVFDDIIAGERRMFSELAVMGIGISIDANLRLTKKRFVRIKKYINNSYITQYKELAGPFLASESCMLACKILRRRMND